MSSCVVCRSFVFRPSLTFHIIDFFSETTELNSTKLYRQKDFNVFYLVCVFRADRKTRWPPWPLIGWDIFDFSSETAERNSTKLYRKQDLNVLYNVCVFRANWKNKMEVKVTVGTCVPHTVTSDGGQGHCWNLCKSHSHFWWRSRLLLEPVYITQSLLMEVKVTVGTCVHHLVTSDGNQGHSWNLCTSHSHFWSRSRSQFEPVYITQSLLMEVKVTIGTCVHHIVTCNWGQGRC